MRVHQVRVVFICGIACLAAITGCAGSGSVLRGTALRWTSAEAPVPSDAQTRLTSTSQTNWVASLYGVSCPRGAACMAVGSYLAPHDSTALVEAVSPGKATPIQMSLPLPTDAAKPSGNDLGAVICVASADCLASGSYDTGKTISLGQGTTENISAGVAENLFGATWGAWPLGSGASGRDRQITIEGLACPAPAQCLTAGYYYADDVSGAVTESRPALLTIAGSSSGPVQVPLPADARQSGGLDTLNSLACTSPGWCVAAGSYTDTHGRLQGLIETLERGSWTAATAALPADAAADQKTHLNGVACTAPGSCIAVGTYAGPGGITQGLIETIKDGSLRAARGPNLAGKHGGELDAIACPGPGNCVAVGDYTTAWRKRASH